MGLSGERGGQPGQAARPLAVRIGQGKGGGAPLFILPLALSFLPSLFLV